MLVKSSAALNGTSPAQKGSTRSRLHRRAAVLAHRLRKVRGPREIMLFLARFASTPGKIGAVAPSSRNLGRAMAAGLPGDHGVCVELGGGTGSLTRAILATAAPRDRLIVVERDPRLAAYLQKRFPGITVVEGDAQNLTQILRDAGVERVDTVVSGLPFRSLPDGVRRNIAAEIFAALGPGGVYVQFTYWGEPPIPADIMREYKITRARTGRVWRNIPPANVWRYERPAAS